MTDRSAVDHTALERLLRRFLRAVTHSRFVVDAVSLAGMRRLEETVTPTSLIHGDKQLVSVVSASEFCEQRRLAPVAHFVGKFLQFDLP